jgi:peptidoglycan/xylan/chitin deacetylase (PgdA/CDA1 family)
MDHLGDETICALRLPKRVKHGFGPGLVVLAGLVAGLHDTNATTRLVAAERIAEFGAGSVSATNDLRQSLTDADEQVRQAATNALARITREAALVERLVQTTSEGGIIRGPRDRKRLALVFTGHGYAEGGDTILDALSKHGAKGSFFLTGDFLTNSEFAPLVRRIVQDGHYLGPHSDKHVLYCPWEGPKKTLVTREEFRLDIEANLQKIEQFGVQRANIRYFLPPYEYYNEEIAGWAKELGLTLVNFTPGTRANADYTEEAERSFVPTRTIFDSIVAKEKEDPNGLNGFLLLLHVGSGPGRADKFHARFGELLDWLAAKGYQCVRVDELLEGTGIK